MRFRSAVPVIVFLVGITLTAITVQANPRPVQKPETMEVAQFFFILFGVNFFINLFWYSLFALAVLAWRGPGAAKISKSRARFHLSIVGSVVVLTLLGVCIDYLFLYEKDNGWMYFVFDGGRWAAAALLVGLSVLVFSYLIIRMKPRYCLVLAGGMMGMNLFLWGMLGAPYLWELWCTPLVCVLLLPLVFYELNKWHRKQIGTSQRYPDITGHPG